MNLNNALVVAVSVLVLLVVATIINFSRSKSLPRDFVSIDADIVMTNVVCVPEIIYSYESVKEIYGKKNTLFFRYVPSVCSPCLDSQLNEILALQEVIGKDNIWILSSFPDDRNSKIRLNSELSNFNYKNIPADSLLIPICNGKQRSYFIYVNNLGNVYIVFLPDEGNGKYTRDFLLEVRKRLNKTH